jgi:hypothetical protein
MEREIGKEWKKYIGDEDREVIGKEKVKMGRKGE